MKMNKTITALVLALGAASAADAQQQIYIAGATVFRTDIYYALRDMGLTVQAGATTANNTFTFTGTVNNSTIGTITNGSSGQSVQVFVALTGTAEVFPILVNDVSPIYTNTSGAAFSYANGADLGFSDVQQNSTIYANLAPPNELSSADGLASSFGAGIAVEPYVWAASADANGKVGNVTPYIVNDIFVNGTEPLSFFDGVATDAGVNVYLIGRTNDAGTRISAEQVVGFDPGQQVNQYTLNGTLGTPAASGTYQVVGNNGYSSSGNVVKALNVKGAGAAIGYIAFTDGATLLNGALPISYEGVSPFIGSSWTANTTPWNIPGVENGSYTFWSYEHLFVNTKVATTSFIYSEFGPDLINAIEYEVVHPPAGTVQVDDLIKNMNVHRNSDGTDVLPGN
jgi:hypothetical protein